MARPRSLQVCPFCGHGATIIRDVLGTAEGHRVECTHCKAQGPFTTESEQIARIRWNQRYTGTEIPKVSRNNPQSINKALIAGLEIWNRNPTTGQWERVREARSNDGFIQVRTERPDWTPIKELVIGINPTLSTKEQEQVA